MLMPRALPRIILNTTVFVGLGFVWINSAAMPVSTMTAVSEQMHGDKSREKKHPHPVLRKPFHDLPRHS